eukprot:TRINITY_DN1167_c0_g1_i1.p1 TRINITY_DN1167_c0_g1~~TRINITY_DN1167_c0_g1_i1.p1  ORF type:complete len:247 (-),score=63.52 TRINITY_DN1167_c0_g1_i1:154-894(-)
MSKSLLIIFVFILFIAISICQSTCGGFCTTSSDCSNSTCPTCRLQKCVANGQCLSYCDDDSDCYSGSCSQCVNNQCKDKCGAACTTSSECPDSCDSCINGICQAPKCGATCFVNSDCAGIGNCSACFVPYCTSYCGNNCMSDEECNGYNTGCGSCVNGICQKGLCNATCANNNACESYPTSTCNYCNPNSRTCQIGLACGAQCAVDTDCQQGPGSPCNFCINKVCSSNSSQGNKNKHEPLKSHRRN